MSYFKVLFFLVCVNTVYCGRKGGALSYATELKSGLMPCEGIENEVMDATDLQLLVEDDQGKINGTIYILKDILEGAEIVIMVYKITAVGPELVYEMEREVCTSIKDEDMPWTAFYKKVKMETCPIKIGMYHLLDFIVNLKWAEPFLNRNMVGEYKVVMNTRKGISTVNCYSLILAIIEVIVKLFKYINDEWEKFFEGSGDMCSSLDDTEAPWYIIFEALGLKKCPIVDGAYDVLELVLSLDFLAGFKSQEYCGDWKVQMSMDKGKSDMDCGEDKPCSSCFEMGVEIKEKKEEEEKEK